jgi:ribosome modulation factor
MQSDDPFALGQQAARGGKEATDCPYEMGKHRRLWLKGYFSIKPRLEDNDPEREEEA